MLFLLITLMVLLQLLFVPVHELGHVAIDTYLGVPISEVHFYNFNVIPSHIPDFFAEQLSFGYYKSVDFYENSNALGYVISTSTGDAQLSAQEKYWNLEIYHPLYYGLFTLFVMYIIIKIMEAWLEESFKEIAIWLFWLLVEWSGIYKLLSNH